MGTALKSDGKTFNEWLEEMVRPDEIEARLAKLTPSRLLKNISRRLTKRTLKWQNVVSLKKPCWKV